MFNGGFLGRNECRKTVVRGIIFLDVACKEILSLDILKRKISFLAA